MTSIQLQQLYDRDFAQWIAAIPDYYRGWQVTIQTQRNALRRLLTQSPLDTNFWQ